MDPASRDDWVRTGLVPEVAASLAEAVAAAEDAPGLSRRLPPLLNQLAPRADDLGPFPRGVLEHLRGLSAWRVERDVPGATRALGASLAHLEAGMFGTEAGTATGTEAGAYAGRVFDTLGQMLQQQGLLVEARGEFERALERKRAHGDEAGAALTEGNLGRLCMALGEFEAAARHLGEDLDFVARQAPRNLRLECQLLTQIGACLSEQGEAGLARERLAEAKRLAEGAGDTVGAAFAAAYRGRNALRAGDREEARAAVQDVAAGLRSLPEDALPELRGLAAQLDAEVAHREGDLATALARYGEAERRFAAASRVSPVEYAELLQAHAGAALEAGDRRGAADLLRRALRQLDATTAQAMRARLDALLREADENTWMLHGAGRFVGHGQIERLLAQAGQSGFRGRAEDVTILFSDLRGFTTLTEGLDPDVLVGVLNRYLGHMTRCVEHFGGYVDKFIGDAVMAVFSLPSPRADDADRAVEAALYMEAELARFNRTLPEGFAPLASGLGLHHGRVVAGLIGSPQKRSYTVLGDAVNTASRLEGMTKLLGVPALLTREVRDRLTRPDRYLLLPFGRLRPKGRRGAVEVYGLAGLRDGGAASRAADVRIAEAEAALARLVAGDLREARRRFETLATGAHAAATAYAWLAERVAEIGPVPPPGWDGTIVLTEK